MVCSLRSLCAMITGGYLKATLEGNIYEIDFFPDSHWVIIYKTQAKFDLIFSFYRDFA